RARAQLDTGVAHTLFGLIAHDLRIEHLAVKRQEGIDVRSEKRDVVDARAEWHGVVLSRSSGVLTLSRSPDRSSRTLTYARCMCAQAAPLPPPPPLVRLLGRALDVLSERLHEQLVAAGFDDHRMSHDKVMPHIPPGGITLAEL